MCDLCKSVVLLLLVKDLCSVVVPVDMLSFSLSLSLLPYLIYRRTVISVVYLSIPLDPSLVCLIRCLPVLGGAVVMVCTRALSNSMAYPRRQKKTISAYKQQTECRVGRAAQCSAVQYTKLGSCTCV